MLSYNSNLVFPARRAPAVSVPKKRRGDHPSSLFGADHRKADSKTVAALAGQPRLRPLPAVADTLDHLNLDRTSSLAATSHPVPTEDPLALAPACLASARALALSRKCRTRIVLAY